MDNLIIIEESYQKFKRNLKSWLPEDIVIVDIALLQRFSLLNDPPPQLTSCFHIIESSDKLTLVNSRFVVWISAEWSQHSAATETLIALNLKERLSPQLAFIARGVYNNSCLVLHLLEKFLTEIQENERAIEKLFSS